MVPTPSPPPPSIGWSVPPRPPWLAQGSSHSPSRHQIADSGSPGRAEEPSHAACPRRPCCRTPSPCGSAPCPGPFPWPPPRHAQHGQMLLDPQPSPRDVLATRPQRRPLRWWLRPAASPRWLLMRLAKSPNRHCPRTGLQAMAGAHLWVMSCCPGCRHRHLRWPQPGGHATGSPPRPGSSSLAHAPTLCSHPPRRPLARHLPRSGRRDGLRQECSPPPDPPSALCRPRPSGQPDSPALAAGRRAVARFWDLLLSATASRPPPPADWAGVGATHPILSVDPVGGFVRCAPPV